MAHLNQVKDTPRSPFSDTTTQLVTLETTVESHSQQLSTTFTQVVHDALPNPHHSNTNDLTAEQKIDLTDGGQTTLHSHAGGGGEAFPIGSVFLAVVNTNPAALLGYGTWSQIASGKFLVGQNSGDVDFDTAEETGGEKTHTLATNEIPSHSHVLGELRSATTGSQASYIARTADTSSTRGTDKSTELTGGGLAHNNLPPYFVAYIWKRTA